MFLWNELDKKCDPLYLVVYGHYRMKASADFYDPDIQPKGKLYNRDIQPNIQGAKLLAFYTVTKTKMKYFLHIFFGDEKKGIWRPEEQII
jgi:hypothetical protein